MNQRCYTDEQIAFALRQAGVGTALAEVCRRVGVSEPTFYRWKKQFDFEGAATVLEEACATRGMALTVAR
jgi:putative transposase